MVVATFHFFAILHAFLLYTQIQLMSTIILQFCYNFVILTYCVLFNFMSTSKLCKIKRLKFFNSSLISLLFFIILLPLHLVFFLLLSSLFQGTSYILNLVLKVLLFYFLQLYKKLANQIKRSLYHFLISPK